MAKPAPDRLKQLRSRIAKAPTESGIYRWLNDKGDVLYVGKAKNLRARLKSYVQENPDKSLGPWKLSLIQQIADVDMTVVNSELEALVLETNLIKTLKPKYNVLMKDDKNYVYVRITMQDTYPRVDIVRKMEHDGAKYFGPKTSAEQVRQALGILRKIFPFRTCKMEIELGEGGDGSSMPSIDVPSSTKVPLQVVCTHKDRPTPCLDHHIGQCSAPCAGLRSPEEYYKESIDGVTRFFKGDHDGVKELLQEKMKQAAVDKKFELAAELRDQLKHIEELQEKQLVSDTSGEDNDFIGVALLAGRAQVVLLQERGGKVIGESSLALAGQADSIEDVLLQFLPQYYLQSAEVPDAVYIGEEIEDRETLEQWLTSLREKKVKIHVPERGKKSKLLELAEKNAQQKAKQLEAKWEADARNTEDALTQLQELLSLPEKPMRIEGYDISHLGGTETVGSMVVMKGGKPANPEYRSFTIHTMKSGMIDDYRALKEVLQRRLRHLDEEREERKWAQRGVVFAKAVKADADHIHEGIGELSPGATAVDYKECLLAKEGEEIVSSACLHIHENNALELVWMWAHPKYQREGLAQAVARRMLHKLKKGKVYAIAHPAQESLFAELGFRYVVKPPVNVLAIAQQRGTSSDDATERIVLMYDAAQNKTDGSLSSRPDLLVIDGGKGQLNAVVEVLKMLELEIPIIGLAKREEDVFVPGDSAPVHFPKDAPAKFLLMRLRDEAHRFANRHRERRGARSMKGSILDTVQGIGPETKKILLRQFGSVDQIAAASDDELGRWISSEQIAKLREVLE